MKKLDLSDVSFDNVDIRSENFAVSKGVKINPQTVWKKDISGTILEGVEIIGGFDGCDIRYANFAGSVGAVINPQTIMGKSFNFTKLKDVTFNDSFDGCDIRKTNFTGSHGAVINPQTIRKQQHYYNISEKSPSFEKTVLTDTVITGSFDGCYTKDMVLDGTDLSQVVGQLKEQIRTQVIKRTL